MNSLNLTAAKLTACHLPSLNPHRPSFRNPSSLRLHPIRASLQNPNQEISNPPLHFPKLHTTPAVSRVPIPAPLKSALVTTVTAAALLLSGLHVSSKPAIAVPVSPPPAVETAEKESVSDLERERVIEEHMVSNPYDVDGLKNLMEIKIKARKIPEAIEIIEKLMRVEPEEVEWPMMRAHLYAHNGEFELAKNGFSELLEKDPFRVEAYHGLVTVASQEESNDELGGIEKKVLEAIELCKKENKMSDLRDFKLLVAQIRVLEGRYDEALKVYQELVKDEPRDFRPYLCQGIIYTLLRKNSEAEKNFEKYRRLVPKGHPYTNYFDENMIATKIFAQKVENERAMAKS